MPDKNLAILLDRFMRRFHRALHQKAPEFDTEKVGQGGAMILLTLSETGRAPMHTLSRALVRDKSQMTRAVRPLERKGLVERTSSEKDCRVSMISLTAKGQAVVEAHQNVIAETLDELLDPLPEEGKETFKALLRQATSAL